MSNTPELNPALLKEISINPCAVFVENAIPNGKRCQLIDNTGTIDEQSLKELLVDFIESGQFGINAMSSTDGIINLDKPRLSHMQINENLYRILIFRYQAVIEKF